MVVTKRFGIVANSLTDAPWLHMGAGAGAQKSVESGGRHAVGPRKRRLRKNGGQPKRCDNLLARQQPLRAAKQNGE